MRECFIRIEAVITFLLAATFASAVENPFSDVFSSYPEGCIVILDTETGETHMFNEDRCAERFLPASTFKIANALIGLETGVIKGPNHQEKWDGSQRRVESWNKNHDLRSAIKNSVVWYFERMAKRVGTEKIEKFLLECEYGNALTSGDETFWLKGDLSISAFEQIAFLQRLYNRSLTFRNEVMDTVIDLIFFEKHENYKLYGKTGWIDDYGINLGWFVGWVETGSGTVFFALNIESKSSQGFASARVTIVKKCLERLGYW